MALSTCGTIDLVLSAVSAFELAITSGDSIWFAVCDDCSMQ